MQYQLMWTGAIFNPFSVEILQKFLPEFMNHTMRIQEKFC